MSVELYSDELFATRFESLYEQQKRCVHLEWEGFDRITIGARLNLREDTVHKYFSYDIYPKLFPDLASNQTARHRWQVDWRRMGRSGARSQAARPV